MHRARDHGCAVVSFGKLHFRSGRDDNGFSEEILPMHLAFDGLGWPTGLLRDPLPVFQSAHELADLTGCAESEYTEYDRRITEATCDWLRKNSNQSRQHPWVLFVSFVSPHYPLTAPEAFYKLYEHSDKLGKPMHGPTNGIVQHPVLKEVRDFWNYDDFFTDELRIEARKNYFGLISFLDDNIRQVLKALESHNSPRDTLILYTSDHGEMLGHLGFWAKSVMYEDSVGVPLIAAGGGFKRQRCDAPVSLTNINNTVLEAIGIESTADTSCLNESLQSVASSPEVPRFTFSEYHDGGTPVGYFMIRENDFKLVHYAGGHSPQLFNVREDPWEMSDLAHNPAYTQQLNQLQKRLYALLDPNAVMEDYTRDQVALIEQLGGRERILAISEFNHTPLPNL